MHAESADPYGEAIGAVMAARKRYEELCAAHGAESWAAQQAQEYLTRAIAHRNEMRTQYAPLLEDERG